MRGGAHGLDAEHEIFRSPYAVDLTFEQMDTPSHYRKYVDGAELGDKIPVWRVHDELPYTNVGLVADGYRFEDSPDAELISGGINSKNPGAVALGRQGNWFLWGFCAAPDEMRESARLVFLNVLAYMKHFDGERALGNRVSRARDWALNYARLYQAERRDEVLTRRFGSLLLQKSRRESEAFEGWLRDNLAYLYSARREVEFEQAGRQVREMVDLFVLDVDAQSLEIPNWDLALLERCVGDLERGEHEERALRLLDRYTDEQHGADAAAWRSWLDENRTRLYFSDALGYRFFVHERGDAARPLEVQGLELDDPVGVEAMASDRELRVMVDIAPPWYLHAPGGDEAMPIRVDIAPGSGFEPAGKLVVVADADGHVRGRSEFVLPLRRVSDGEGLRAALSYQACDQTRCLPPHQVRFVGADF